MVLCRLVCQPAYEHANDPYGQIRKRNMVERNHRGSVGKAPAWVRACKSPMGESGVEVGVKKYQRGG
jgi:hypothetical protein